MWPVRCSSLKAELGFTVEVQERSWNSVLASVCKQIFSVPGYCATECDGSPWHGNMIYTIQVICWNSIVPPESGLVPHTLIHPCSIHPSFQHRYSPCCRGDRAWGYEPRWMDTEFSAKDRYMENSLKWNEETFQWRHLASGRSEVRRLSPTLLEKANVHVQS